MYNTYFLQANIPQEEVLIGQVATRILNQVNQTVKNVTHLNLFNLT